GDTRIDRLSPKAGAIWTPWRDTTVRAAYTRSLGGVSFDQSFQLEPSQIAGFGQTFRSLIPESVSGALSAQRFETYGVALDQKFPTRTYFSVAAELLRSRGTQTVGTYEFLFPTFETSVSSTTQRLNFEEKLLSVTVNQLLSKEISVLARYQLRHADLDESFPDLPPAAFGSPKISQSQNPSATLH